MVVRRGWGVALSHMHLAVAMGGSATTPSPEARLVAMARTGDRAAFGELYRAHARLIHGILLSRAPLPDVNDLLQDVFVAALDRLPSLVDDEKFAPWLASIARNLAIDHLRTRRAWSPFADEHASRSPTPPGAVDALRRVLALPEGYREIMVLRLVEGMTGPEIALRCGLTPGSVRVKLCRGMKLLRASRPGAR